MRLSEKPQTSNAYVSHSPKQPLFTKPNAVNAGATTVQATSQQSKGACYSSKSPTPDVSTSTAGRYIHDGSTGAELQGCIQATAGFVGGATACGGAEGEGEGGSVDDVLKNAALMVCQSRQPDVASSVGYSDGIHSPLNKQKAHHVCSQTDHECQTNRDMLKVIDAVNSLNSPLVVEIWLYADYPSFESSKSGGQLELIQRTDSEEAADPVLIEVWTFQKILKRQSSDPAHFVDANSLYQAIRSHLSFSQLASWLVKSNGKSPRNVQYKLCPGGDILSPSSKLPLQCFDFHKFPHCYPDRGSNYFVSTEVRFLKRDVHPKSSPSDLRDLLSREGNSSSPEAVKPLYKIGDIRKGSDIVCGVLPERDDSQSPCNRKNAGGPLFTDGSEGSDYDSGTLQSRKKTRGHHKERQKDERSPRQKLYCKLMHSLGHADRKTEDEDNSDSSDCLAETMVFKNSIFESSSDKCCKKEDNKLIISRMTDLSDSGESLVDVSKTMDEYLSSQFVPAANSDVNFALSHQLPSVLAQKSSAHSAATEQSVRRKLFTVGGSGTFSNETYRDDEECSTSGSSSWHVGVDTVDIDSVFLDGVLTHDATNRCLPERERTKEYSLDGKSDDDVDGAGNGAMDMVTHFGALLTSQPRTSDDCSSVATTGLNIGATSCSNSTSKFSAADQRLNNFTSESFSAFASNSQPQPTFPSTSFSKLNQSQWKRKDQLARETNKRSEREFSPSLNGFLGSNKSLDLHLGPQPFGSGTGGSSSSEVSPVPIWSPSDGVGVDPYRSLSNLLCGFEHIAQSAPQPKIEHLKLMGSSHSAGNSHSEGASVTDPVCKKKPGTTVDSELEPVIVKRALSYSSNNGMCFNANTGLPLSSSPIAFRRMSKSVSFHSKDALSGLIDSSEVAAANRKMSVGLGSVRNRTWSVSNRSLAGHSSASSSSSSQLSLVVNFEESVLNGRIEPFGVIEGFKADIGAAGGKFCPKHATINFAACYYNLSDDGSPSPYFGYISLESLGKRGYRVPRKGQVQVTLFNPNGSLIKIFIVMFDLSSMPPNHHTFLRQRTFLMPCSSSRHTHTNQKGPVPVGSVAQKCQDKHSAQVTSSKKATLRYLLHLRFQSSSSGKIYLHTDIRCIFSRNQGYETTMDAGSQSHCGNFQLKSFTEVPQNPQFSPCKST